MNWNKNNNDNNPWGSGGNNNPWGSGGSGDGPNRRDFEDSIKKAKDRFGNFKFGGRRNLSIFIIPPSITELRKRLISRGLDSSDVIEKRLTNARTELKYAEQYDYIVLNDIFENTLNELVSIIYDENYKYNKNTYTNLLKDLLD